MKRILSTIIVLTSFTPLCGRQATNFKEKSSLIAKVDGTFIGAAEIHDTLRAINVINEVLFGAVDKATKKRTGLYTLADEQLTAQDLAKKDQALAKEGVEKTDARRLAIAATLTTAKDDFNTRLKALRKPSEKESDMAKSMKNTLLKVWLEDQNITDSLLANSDKDDEKEKMYAASPAEFCRFLVQLKNFLEDLNSSCTKAQEQYKAVVQQAQQK